jgi:hypothetical protein
MCTPSKKPSAVTDRAGPTGFCPGMILTILKADLAKENFSFDIALIIPLFPRLVNFEKIQKSIPFFLICD